MCASILATGCGGGSSLDVEDLCSAEGGFVVAIQKQIDCNPEFVEILFGAPPTSEELETACREAFNPLIETGTVEFVGSQSDLEACLATVEAASCDTFDIDQLGGACDEILAGLVAVGDECESSDQCENDGYCDESGSGCGVCVARKPNAASCTDSDECESRFCSDAGECRAIGDIGDSCTDNDGCVGRLVCNSISGACQRPETWQAGDTCGAETDDCAVTITGLICGEGSCIALGTEGDACGGEGDLPCNFFAALTCGDNDTCVAATPVGSGESCSLTSGQTCETGLVCRDIGIQTGTCDDKAAIGDSCNENDDIPCPGQFLMECVGGMCQYGDYEGICTGE